MPRNPNEANEANWSCGLAACIDSFCVIEDPRTGGNKLHHFGEVLFMAVSAMLDLTNRNSLLSQARSPFFPAEQRFLKT